MSIQLAGGSQVLSCTDGISNVGLGSLAKKNLNKVLDKEIVASSMYISSIITTSCIVS